MMIISISAATTDSYNRRIDNRLMAAGFVAAALLHIILPADADIGSIILLTLYLILLAGLFGAHLLGGGDVKIYAFTAFLYPEQTGIRIIAVSIAIAGVYAVLLIAIRLMNRGCCSSQSEHENKGDGKNKGSSGTKKSTVPMAACIAAASAAVFLYGSVIKI